MTPGIGKICAICQKKITLEDDANKNRPMRISGIPGFVHRKCKIQYDGDVINSGTGFEDLTDKIKEL